jgi:hypothetical protein
MVQECPGCSQAGIQAAQLREAQEDKINLNL